ncbi:DDE-type integrase/transposase/recombinase [Aestuariibius insulae]|uniref:DDE-type integrase/transposase/recombinase n=1 Tax=Aestuariibius insulae TaxID=2058287 RepID=UPI00345E0711
MRRRDPFRGYRLPKDVILLTVRWYCRHPLSYRTVRDLLAERGITVDEATVYRWAQKVGPEYPQARLWPTPQLAGTAWHARSGPADAIRHVTRTHLNDRVEGDHAVLKHRPAPMYGLQSLRTAKATLKGVETFRAIRTGHFAGCERRVANEIAFVPNLFSDAKEAA